MKVEKVREKDGKLELTVELDGKETTREMQRVAADEIAKNNYKTTPADDNPVEFLRKHLGASEAAFAIDEAIMRHRVPFALTAAGVDAIGRPVYKCLEHATEDKPFTYHLVCVLVPEFTLSDYGPVTITMPSAEVKDEEVEEEIQKMAQASATPIADTTHDTVVKGDRIELAMETTLDGEKVKALCTDQREYATGTYAMPDAFDEGVIGMKLGETKEIVFEGPQLELGADGKPIMEQYVSTVTVKRILKMKTPELSDTWARSVMPNVKSLSDLHAKVREKLEERSKDDHDRRALTLAATELARRLEGDISDLIYAVAIKEAREELTARLREENISLDDYLKKEGIEKDQLNNVLLMQVRGQLTRQFALNAYAEHENLTVEEEDLEAFFESIAPNQASKVMDEFKRDGKMYAARCAARRLKANKIVVEKATINDASAKTK